MLNNTFFTSDLHFHHKNIIKLAGRPFGSIHEMHVGLGDQINKIVGDNGNLWVLGDFSFSRSINQVRALRNRIKTPHVHLVRGNHDSRKILTSDIFESVHDYKELRIEDVRFVLFHYAQVVWNKSHHGTIQLHGHSHSSLHHWMQENMPTAKTLDVGVDNVAKLFGEYRPVSAQEVLDWMDKNGKTGMKLDHH